MLGDHIYTSGEARRCARQALDVFEHYGASVSAVQQTPTELLHLFGTVCGKRLSERPPVYDIEHIYEKPAPEYAEANLRQSGLLHGMYLCFFGIHVMTPAIFNFIQLAIDNNLRENGEFQFTSAQERLRESGERYLAVETNGVRHDIGIAVTLQTRLLLETDPSQHQRPATLGPTCKGVLIKADPYS